MQPKQAKQAQIKLRKQSKIIETRTHPPKSRIDSGYFKKSGTQA